MEQENLQENETQVVVVKPEEIKTLTDLGFKEDEDLMVLETDNGVVGVDKETGIVAVDTNGASVEENAIIAELVTNGVAEVVSANELDVEEVENELTNNNTSGDNSSEEE